MNMSLFEKLGILFKYMFSSFLPIGMFIMSLLLLCILLINVKLKNKYIEGKYKDYIYSICLSDKE